MCCLLAKQVAPNNDRVQRMETELDDANINICIIHIYIYMQTPTSRGCRFQISLFSDGFQTSVEVAPRTQHDNIWDADTELEAITGHAGSGCHDMSRHVTTCHDIVQQCPGLVPLCSRNSYWYTADSDLIALAASLLDNSFTTSSWRSLLDEPSPRPNIFANLL